MTWNPHALSVRIRFRLASIIIGRKNWYHFFHMMVKDLGIDDPSYDPESLGRKK